MPCGTLVVRLLRGSQLANHELFGKMKVFATLALKGEAPTKLGTVHGGGTEPDFSKSEGTSLARLRVTNGKLAELTLELYDEETIKQHDFIGRCALQLDGLLWPPETGGVPPLQAAPRSKQLKLRDDQGNAAGFVDVELSFEPDPDWTPEPSAVRDPAGEEEKDFTRQAASLVDALKAAGPHPPRVPSDLLARPAHQPADGVPLYEVTGPLQVAIVDVRPAEFEEGAHLQICSGHFARVFLMHGRHELARAEEALGGGPAALGLHEPMEANAETPDIEGAFAERSEFMQGTKSEPIECSRIPKEAEIVVCVYCRRAPDKKADGDTKGKACDGRGLDEEQAPVVGKSPEGGPAVLVAWASLQVFDADGVLRDGFFKLDLWRQRPTVDYKYQDNCEKCKEQEQTVQCDDCVKEHRKLCDDCDDEIHEQPGMKGHSATRLPTARMRTKPRPGAKGPGPLVDGYGNGDAAAAEAVRHWGSILLRVDPPHAAPRPPVFFAYNPKVLAAFETAGSFNGLAETDGASEASSPGLDLESKEMRPFAEALRRHSSAKFEAPSRLSPHNLSRSNLLRPPCAPSPSSLSAGTGTDADSDSEHSVLEEDEHVMPLASEARTHSGHSLGHAASNGTASSWSESQGGRPRSTRGRRRSRRWGRRSRGSGGHRGLGRKTSKAFMGVMSGFSTLLRHGSRKGPPPPKTDAQKLHDFIAKGNDPYWTPDEKDKALMRSYANLFVDVPIAFGKMVECLDYCRTEDCVFLDKAIQHWSPLNPRDALQLLDNKYPDLRVRRYAAERIADLPDEELAEYMLQLVQGMRHTAYLDGPLARLLFWRGLRNPRLVGISVFWALKWAEGEETSWGHRCKVLLEQFQACCRSAGHSFLDDQVAFVELAADVAKKIIVLKPKDKNSDLYSQKLKALLEEAIARGRVPPAFTVPVDPHFEISGIDLSQPGKTFKVYSSGKHPYELTFSGKRVAEAKAGAHAAPTISPAAGGEAAGAGAEAGPGAEGAPQMGFETLSTVSRWLAKLKNQKTFRDETKGEANIRAIFKAGQDLRADELFLKMLCVMDRLWKAEDLNLMLTPYKCISTGRGAGVIEVVKGATTIGDIQAAASDGSVIAAAVGEKNIANWLRKRSATEEDYQKARKKFATSCAGYCVATYVMGLCDRHSDNVMLFDDGRMFHIDFGRYLGHVTKILGFIPKETAPFLFTAEYKHVLEESEGSPSSSCS
eukprot:tig00020943_g16338.t1